MLSKFSISLGMILRKSVVIREYRIQRLIVVFLSKVWKKGLEATPQAHSNNVPIR